jgi:acyl-CoA synthetase (AMP-forming)/AMP-acid ligase II
MYPGHWAKVKPDDPAVIMAHSGEVVTHGELNERSNRLARYFRAEGLVAGDHIALLLENHPYYLEVVWAALRSGLYVTTVNRYLTVNEAGYIIDNCDARVLIASSELAVAGDELLKAVPSCPARLVIGGAVNGYLEYDDVLAGQEAGPLAQEPLGEFMLYSSGTTGRPKGVARPLSGSLASDGVPFAAIVGGLFGVDEQSVYLCPAPLYHTAPLAFSVATTALGGTVVVMEQFDPVEALASIEGYRVTHSQWVPTMFARMLRLTSERRARFNLSSHRVAVHSGAPCPRQVKEEMFEWWGPILHEYYGGTELNGMTYVGPQDWLSHPGTVGRPVLGTVHICDDVGAELPAEEVGTIYFELPVQPFSYYQDDAQTRSVQHPTYSNWTTLGDVGRVDNEGFLYLTDRATFMIVSGGVNIYPQEIEDCLVMHPKVADVAVFGVPNEEMGEEVKAVVQPLDAAEATVDLERELMAFVRERLAHYKCPRSIDFTSELPRLPTGKLYKQQLRDRYWEGRSTRIA